MVMAGFETFNFGNVLQNVDQLRSAQFQRQMYQNQLADYEWQRQERDRLRGQEQQLQAARTSAWGGDSQGMAQLAGLAPDEAIRLRSYYDGLGAEQKAQELAQAKARTEQVSKLAAWVKGAPDEQEAAYRWGVARSTLPEDTRGQIPEQYDPAMVDLAIAQSQSLSEVLAGVESDKGNRLYSDAMSALNSGYFEQMGQKESGGDYGAKNPSSSASGKYQFTDATWKGTMGDKPRTPENQEIAMRKLTDQNAQALQRAGFNPTPELLSLAHQQGVGGAIQLLSNPDAPATSIVGGEAVRLNGGSETMTAGDFANHVMGYYSGQQAGRAEAQQEPQGPQGPQIDPRYLALMQLSGAPNLTEPQRKAFTEIASSFAPQEQFTLSSGQTRFDGQGNEIARGQAPQQEMFRQATPEEAAAYGAVAGQFGPDGRFHAQNPPSGMAIESDGEGGFRMTQGPGITNASKPLNEGQSKNVLYTTKAEGALANLNKVASELTSRTDQVAGAVPFGLGRGFQDPKYQAAQQAANEFLTAILRKETGAAITQEETQIYGSVYLPQPGDSPEVLQQKAESRTRAVDALRRGMTPAELLALEVGSPEQGQPQQPGQPQAPRPGGQITLPSGGSLNWSVVQ